jgi:hypothetical protein
MRELATQAIELEPRATSFGARLLLVPIQFSEYVRHADAVYRLLRNVLRDIHRLEKLVSIRPYAKQDEMRNIVDLQLKIDDLLRGRNRHAAETLSQARQVVEEARHIAEALVHELRDGGRSAV